MHRVWSHRNWNCHWNSKDKSSDTGSWPCGHGNGVILHPFPCRIISRSIFGLIDISHFHILCCTSCRKIRILPQWNTWTTCAECRAFTRSSRRVLWCQSKTCRSVLETFNSVTYSAVAAMGTWDGQLIVLFIHFASSYLKSSDTVSARSSTLTLILFNSRTLPFIDRDHHTNTDTGCLYTKERLHFSAGDLWAIYT